MRVAGYTELAGLASGLASGKRKSPNVDGGCVDPRDPEYISTQFRREAFPVITVRQVRKSSSEGSSGREL